MRLTRFRVASMIAILGCGVAWAASSRAQTGAQQTQQMKTASSTPAGVHQASSFDDSSAVENSPGNDQTTHPLSRQVRELSVPPGATPSPGRKKQVIDLRNRIASNPNAISGNVVSEVQQSQTTLEWVDSAIPQQLFEQALTAPRQQPNTAHQPREAPTIDTRAIESTPQSPASSPQFFNTSPNSVVQQGAPKSSASPSQVSPGSIYSQAGVLPPPDVPPASTQTRPQLPPSVPGQPSLPVQPPATDQSESKPDSAEANPDYSPVFSIAASQPPASDVCANRVDYFPDDFSDCSGPRGSTFDPYAAAHVYRGKFAITTQRPLVELWRPLYTGGVFPPAPTWFGVTNPMKPHFLVYGDVRTAVGVNHNSSGKSNVWGNVLNLDMDLQLTSTERVHAFVSPLNNGTQASGVSFHDKLDLINGTNVNFNTLFFEGDAGALLGGAHGTYPPFDLPFTFGLIPLIYQNGIWANDAVLGAAVALPARHSRALKWSNFDATLFWATDNVTTDAFPNQDSAADFFGTAWFIDAYEGYIEADYAFVNDNSGAGRGYHNLSMAFTRRYLHKLSNSVRFIVNTGQEDLAPINRTADGHLLLIENALISAHPNTIVPYVNLFYGQGRPQSLARVGIAGGILTNTGINFETDGITGYPTLDPTGSNTFGFAGGINMLGSQFAHQLILELAMLQAVGSRQLRNATGDEYGIGVRYQKPLSHNLIFRTDQMVGFREDATNITGSRFELRWKF